jgi:hypothetical protein
MTPGGTAVRSPRHRAIQKPLAQRPQPGVLLFDRIGNIGAKGMGIDEGNRRRGFALC